MAHSQLYNAVRGFFATQAVDATLGSPAINSKGRLATAGLAYLRTAIGELLPSRMYADAFLGLVLVGLSVVLAMSIFSNCQRLGCAFIKLGFLCFFLVVAVFWLYQVWRLSDEEFHNSYADVAAWLVDTVANGEPK
jgi:hypothetical protein